MYRQEENTSIWQQQQQFQPADDDVMDYGGGDIDFGESIEVSLSAMYLKYMYNAWD